MLIGYPGLFPENVPSIVASGEGTVRNFEGQKTDLYYIDIFNPNGEPNRPLFFGSDDPARDLINTPVTNRPFYGYRQVLYGRDSAGNPHFITAIITEMHPSYAGNIWTSTYNAKSSSWSPWRLLTMNTPAQMVRLNLGDVSLVDQASVDVKNAIPNDYTKLTSENFFVEPKFSYVNYSNPEGADYITRTFSKSYSPSSGILTIPSMNIYINNRLNGGINTATVYCVYMK